MTTTTDHTIRLAKPIAGSYAAQYHEGSKTVIVDGIIVGEVYRSRHGWAAYQTENVAGVLRRRNLDVRHDSGFADFRTRQHAVIFLVASAERAEII